MPVPITSVTEDELRALQTRARERGGELAAVVDRLANEIRGLWRDVDYEKRRRMKGSRD